MPRLIRRRPLMERVKAMLNPMDFLLWLSEEIETRDWDSKLVGTQLGLATNFAFLLARANSGGSRVADPVFDDGATASGWIAYLVGTIVWLLIAFSGSNAFYTMYRTRKYRLFEVDVEKTNPGTPNARRVRVQSSPAVSSSPMRLLTEMVSYESAESRAHPDSTRDVWEISMWDPLPICLQLFCLFSPGHVLIYMMFLPLAPLDVRPSVTVFNCLVLQVIMSVQLMLFVSRFSQQNKDTAVIQKEVLHEYDTKFVHPNLYPTVRDAGTQFTRDDFGNDQELVVVGTPTVQLRRGFRTNPNPNYAKHIDPDYGTGNSNYVNNAMSTGFFTPPVHTRHSDQFSSDLRNKSSAIKLARRSTPGPTPLRESLNANARSSMVSSSTSTADGGYMGIMNHPNSPLKKTPSLGEMQFRSPRNNSEMAQMEQYQSYQQQSNNFRSPSPIKSATRKSTGSMASSYNNNAYGQPASNNPWGRTRIPGERYPSMFQ
ncbi:hypothetical protein F5Y16DRAFT_412795 [Xylariaceae sp. FL0255]|nr:hypothetical protein F5Y16DRAFT_412795 [Xylariaceae sp. FL0255]